MRRRSSGICRPFTYDAEGIKAKLAERRFRRRAPLPEDLPSAPCALSGGFTYNSKAVDNPEGNRMLLRLKTVTGEAMAATLKKIVKPAGVAPTEVETEVAKCLYDIECRVSRVGVRVRRWRTVYFERNVYAGVSLVAWKVWLSVRFRVQTSSQSDLKGEVRSLVISSVKEVEVVQSRKKALVVFVPYAIYQKTVKKIQGRLVQELEKKLKKHVVLIAQRSMLPLDFKRKGLKVRPRSRTLTAVQESMLEDMVGPTEIVGKR
ncbi:UNVERIFIED_CONTAM: hypothetical protein H355_010002 [Colinus virginianus]|nr:hypothetical protein H355_010002 [Colinus virginianus]